VTDRNDVTVTVPHRLRNGQIVELPESLAASLSAWRSEPYHDPRSSPLADDKPRPPAVEVLDVIEVRPGCDRPHRDEPEDIES